MDLFYTLIAIELLGVLILLLRGGQPAQTARRKATTNRKRAPVKRKAAREKTLTAQQKRIQKAQEIALILEHLDKVK